MKIRQFLKKDCPEVSTESRVDQVYESINESKCAIVYHEDGSLAGVLGSADMMECTGGVIGNCFIEKPRVDGELPVAEAIALMSNEGTDVLAVYDGAEFQGAVSIHDLALQLLTKGEQETAGYRVIVHDLRNCISNLQSLNGLLTTSVSKPGNLEILELAKQSCSHALDILHKVLYESPEEEKGLTELIDLNSFTKKSLDELKGILKDKDIKLVENLGLEPFYYDINRTDFRRSLHNLISNAVKFSFVGGTITISSNIQGDTFRLSIADGGIGIPEDTKPFVFDQFSEVSRTGTNGEPSTGIGLHYTKSIVEKFGGKLELKSQEGKGTSFTVEFANIEHKQMSNE